jgi:hypothetical protein
MFKHGYCLTHREQAFLKPWTAVKWWTTVPLASASAIATDAALAVGLTEDAPFINRPKAKMDGNVKPSAQQQKKGSPSQHKNNDYLT